MKFFSIPLFNKLTDDHIQNVSLSELERLIKSHIYNAVQLRGIELDNQIYDGLPNIFEMIMQDDRNKATDILMKFINMVDPRIRNLHIQIKDIDTQNQIVYVECNCDIFVESHLYKTSFRLDV